LNHAAARGTVANQEPETAEMETYMTINELAKHLRMAPQTVRKWTRKSDIPFRKIGGAIRFRLSEIEKWVDDGADFLGEQEQAERTGEPKEAGE